MLTLVALAGLVIVFLAVPGFLALRLLGSQIRLAFCAGPSLTVAALVFLNLTYHWLHIRWSLLSVVVGIAILLSLIAASNRIWRLSDLDNQYWHSWKEPAIIAGGVVIGIALLIAPLFWTITRADLPIQSWDPVFHLSGIEAIRVSGDAYPRTALAPLYGGIDSFYPTVWHSIAALIPAPSLTAANVMVITTLALFPLGMVPLMGVISWHADTEKYQSAWIAAVAMTAIICGIGTSVMVITVTSPVWPYALSVALCAPVWALANHALRNRCTLGRHLLDFLIALVALAGLSLVHPSAVFASLIFLVPVVLVIMWRLSLRLWHQKRHFLIAIVWALPGLALLLAVIRLQSRITAMSEYERPGEGFFRVLRMVALNLPLSSDYSTWQLQDIAVLALAIVGLIISTFQRRARSLMLSLIVTALLVGAAGGRNRHLAIIATPWYNDPGRVAPLLTIAIILFAGLGTQALITFAIKRYPQTISSRPPKFGNCRAVWNQGPSLRNHHIAAIICLALITALVTSTGGGNWILKQRLARIVYVPAYVKWSPYLQPGEERFMRKTIAPLVSAGEHVLGDPLDGTPYLWYLTRMHPTFPQIGWINEPQHKYLTDHLASLGKDPQVCHIMKEWDIQYYYRDTSPKSARAQTDRIIGKPRGQLAQLPDQYLQLIVAEDFWSLYRIKLPC